MFHEFHFPLYDLVISPPPQQLDKYPIIGDHILQTLTPTMSQYTLIMMLLL